MIPMLLTGMLAHFYKRKAKSQTLTGLKNYIVGHPAYTVMALAATIGGSLVMAPEVLVLTDYTALLGTFTPIFMAGYMCDSVINKTIGES